MPPQTSYAVNMQPYCAGQKVDAMRGDYVESYVAASIVPFGYAVVDGNVPGSNCMVPNAAGLKFRGISLKTDAYSQRSTPVGYSINQMVNVTRKGKIACLVSGAVAADAPAYFNVVTGQFGPQAVPADTAVFTRNAGATGNFTSSAVTATGPAAQQGTYEIEFTDATHYDVIDPNGTFVGSGVLGTAFNLGGLNFTLTAGGTPAVENDGAHIVVTQGAAATDLSPAIFRSSTTGAGIAIVEINMP